MRFLHLADIHLDTPFAGRSRELRERLRSASREAFRRAVDLALDEDVHAVLLAGDLFDGASLSFATEGFLLDELKRLTRAGIPVVYATGNHDPSTLAGRAHALDWPDGMTVVGGPEPVRREISDREGRTVGAVVAAGHEGPAVTDDLASGFPRPTGTLPEVALLHAQVVTARGRDVHERYAPCELSTLEDSGYAYWALGHVHLRQRVSATPESWYPGNLQGRNPRETGAKGGLLVDLSEPETPRIEFRPLAPIRWERLVVDRLEGVRTLDALARTVETAWRDEREADPGLPGTEWLVRVELRGASPLCDTLRRPEDRTALEEMLKGELGLLDAELRTEAVHPPVDPDAHLERQDVLGEALRLLRQARTDAEVLRRVRPDELAGVTPGEDEDAYLRSLLEGLDGELVARMLERDAGDGTP